MAKVKIGVMEAMKRLNLIKRLRKKMKNLYKFIVLGVLSLFIASCSKDKANDLEPKGTVSSQEVLALAAEFAEETEFRANIHHHGKSKPATTTFKTSDFGNGANQIKGFWAVRGATTYIGSIEQAVDDESLLVDNSLCLWDMNNNSIRGAKLKMRVSANDISDTKGLSLAWMGLDGSLKGNKTDGYKLEFQWCNDTEPNCHIRGTEDGSVEEGRHIPVMTPFADYKKFRSDYEGTDKVKFKTRGSLLGIIIDNGSDYPITIEKISVSTADCPLKFRGYFDFSNPQAGEVPFVGYEPTEPWFDISVGAGTNGEVIEVGKSPCFYVWGYPTNPSGNSCKMKLSYKVGSSSTRTKTFTYKIKNGKLFEDGKTYRIGLKFTKEDREIIRTFNNPLDFVVPNDIDNSGQTFVSDKKGATFNWEDVNNLFKPEANNPLSAEYLLPSKERWISIFPPHKGSRTNLPYVRTHGSLGLAQKSLTERAVVGNDVPKEYEATYKYRVRYGKPKDSHSVLTQARLTTYAHRFKGDPKWESAWCYYRDWIGDRFVIVVRCFSLVDGTHSKDVQQWVWQDFEDNPNTTTRYFDINGSEEQYYYSEDEAYGNELWVLRIAKNYGDVYTERRRVPLRVRLFYKAN